MVLYKGCRNANVRLLQDALGCEPDGIFGPITEALVKEFQKEKGLWVDGIVGDKTWALLELASTDASEANIPDIDTGYDVSVTTLRINKHYLPKGQYIETPTKKEYLFLHHTAGWDNPYKVIDQWANDSRGRIATEFVVGGQSIKGDRTDWDGEVVQCIPGNGYGWHLGKNGNQEMHRNSVGIEVCSFGYLKDGKAYTGQLAHPGQICTLKKPFKGYTQWHRYSDAQIDALRELIIHIGDLHQIDIRKGLPELVKDKGADAFEWNVDAYYGRVKGLWSHTNTNKYKWDIFPQPEIMDMLVSL
jgi:N-acetyl-anhydromuramyl-L-alanine amidase AmpD